MPAILSILGISDIVCSLPTYRANPSFVSFSCLSDWLDLLLLLNFLQSYIVVQSFHCIICLPSNIAPLLIMCDRLAKACLHPLAKQVFSMPFFQNYSNLLFIGS